MGVAASPRPLCSASGSVAVVRVDRQPGASGRTSAFRGSGGPCRRCRSSSKGAIGLSRSRASPTRRAGPPAAKRTSRPPFCRTPSEPSLVVGSGNGCEVPPAAASFREAAGSRPSTGAGRSCVSGRLRSCWIFALGSADGGRDGFPHSFGYGQMDRRCHASRWSSVALPPSANTLAPVLLASGKI